MSHDSCKTMPHYAPPLVAESLAIFSLHIEERVKVHSRPALNTAGTRTSHSSPPTTRRRARRRAKIPRSRARWSWGQAVTATGIGANSRSASVNVDRGDRLSAAGTRPGSTGSRRFTSRRGWRRVDGNQTFRLRRRQMVLATAKIEDFDRFWNTFSTKGAEKRKQYGSRGCAGLSRSQRCRPGLGGLRLGRGGLAKLHLRPRSPGDLSGSRVYARSTQGRGVHPPARRLAPDRSTSTNQREAWWASFWRARWSRGQAVMVTGIGAKSRSAADTNVGEPERLLRARRHRRVVPDRRRRQRRG